MRFAAVAPTAEVWSLSYSKTPTPPTWLVDRASYDGLFNHMENAVNTIIYIVGLVVVIGIILSFFGLR